MELAKCLHSAIFNNGKSKQMCKELFFQALVSDQYSVSGKFWVSERNCREISIFFSLSFFGEKNCHNNDFQLLKCVLSL